MRMDDEQQRRMVAQVQAKLVAEFVSILGGLRCADRELHKHREHFAVFALAEFAATVTSEHLQSSGHSDEKIAEAWGKILESGKVTRDAVNARDAEGGN